MSKDSANIFTFAHCSLRKNHQMAVVPCNKRRGELTRVGHDWQCTLNYNSLRPSHHRRVCKKDGHIV